jgi:hypothetical protein
MYIEFDLPRGVDGMPTAMSNFLIESEIESWAKSHNISYKSKTVKYKKRVTFENDDFYLLFAMSWTPKTNHSFWLNYRVVRDLNNKI